MKTKEELRDAIYLNRYLFIMSSPGLGFIAAMQEAVPKSYAFTQIRASQMLESDVKHFMAGIMADSVVFIEEFDRALPAVQTLLVKELRKEDPSVKIIFHGQILADLAAYFGCEPITWEVDPETWAR